MKILAIETSADDTGIAILQAKKVGSTTEFKILANKIHTQIDIHTDYGGIFPMLAKREHGKNIVPTIVAALKEAKMFKLDRNKKIDEKLNTKIKKILERENDVSNIFIEILSKLKKPEIDAIAVTVGPGLEPALWVGISIAKTLSLIWDIPIIPVNHMEGHMLSILVEKKKTFTFRKDTLQFPMLSLLVSGGHTELVLVKEFGKYKIIGSTRDDAAGEAFDKVARMLGLPYPGGPEISRLAKEEREVERKYIVSGRLAQADGPSRENFHQEIIRADRNNILSETNSITLPRPMIHSKDFDFSFSGLKTAVLYMIRDLPSGTFNDEMKSKIAREFEDAVVEVLTKKTMKAINKYKIKTLVVGGGVSANIHLQETLRTTSKKLDPKIKVHFPTKTLSTDNALMIAIAGYFGYQKKKPNKTNTNLRAKGNLSL